MKTPCFSKIIVTMCALFIFGGAFATASRAATYVVTNTGDNGGMNPAPNAGTGTLRQAIVDANANAGADTITFNSSVTGTILLGSALPNLSDDVTISGPGANALTVRRDPMAAAFRIFTINSGKTVTISGLTISGGFLTATFAGGGGILNSGTTTVSNCTVSGNSVTGNSGAFGGGIWNAAGTLTIVNSTVSGNSVFLSGGGIQSEGTLIITNSTVSGNTAGFFGGGVNNDFATMSITNSTITGNRAASNDGGGIRAAGTETLNNTIVAGNFRGTGSTADDINDGTINTANNNLIGDASTSGGISNGTNGNKVGVDPLLAPLAYCGGPTATHMLKSGSPAIDAGSNALAAGLTTDQRGPAFPRVANTTVDIGAFERQASDIDPTLVVTTTADTNTNNTCSTANPCSLRDAITAANASAPDDVIYFAVTGTIPLNTNVALPALDSNMKIIGPGANALIVKRDSAFAFRIFTLGSGKTVAISGLTITNGTVIGPNVGANSGAGIFNDHSILTISDCVISGNSAPNFGQGGGIYNGGDQAGGSATLTVINSTISGNSASVAGGGIVNNGSSNGNATVTIKNSTLSGNASANGGAIFTQAGLNGTVVVKILNSTISDNSGGGYFNNNVGTPGTVTLELSSSILNVGGGSGANIINNGPGTVTSHGYNLSSDAAGGNGTTAPGGFLNSTGDQRNTDPMLGPLANNGGPTFTHGLVCGSPAIDRGKNFAGATTDQRGPGFARIFGAAAVAGGDGTDIGAFEIQTACNTPPTITTASGVTRQQGAASSNSQIATVHDNEDPPTALTVTVNSSNPSNGVTVSNIAIDASGNVTADVVASCSASNASFTLRVTDTGGLHNDATLNVSVTLSNPAVITLNPAATVQANDEHSYKTFTIAQMVQSATDDCNGNVISNVVIEKATSDEVENGPNTGNTLKDIVIASDCQSVQVRAERDGAGDGRVYLVTLRVSDSSGNITRAVYKVSVPRGNNPVVDSGVHYTVLSNCQL